MEKQSIETKGNRLIVVTKSSPISTTSTFYSEKEYAAHVSTKQYVNHLIETLSLNDLCRRSAYLEKYIESMLGHNGDSKSLDDNKLVYFLNVTFKNKKNKKNALKICKIMIKNSITNKSTIFTKIRDVVPLNLNHKENQNDLNKNRK